MSKELELPPLVDISSTLSFKPTDIPTIVSISNVSPEMKIETIASIMRPEVDLSVNIIDKTILWVYKKQEQIKLIMALISFLLTIQTIIKQIKETKTMFGKDTKTTIGSIIGIVGLLITLVFKIAIPDTVLANLGELIFVLGTIFGLWKAADSQPTPPPATETKP